MTAPSQAVSAAGWRTPLVVVLAGSLIILISIGIRAAFGLFLHPMSHDLGFGRGIFAFAIALQNLIWGLAQPFAGAIADRFGTARTIAVGGLVYGIGMLLMSQATDLTTLTISTGFLVGVGLSGTSFAVVLAAIGRCVPDHRRSLALGLGTAAGSLGQFVWVPAGQLFLATYGWSVALLLMGIASFVMVPLATALVGKADGPNTGTEQSMGAALSEASRHPGFRYLTAGFFVCGFHVTFIATHLPAYVRDAGLPVGVGAWALALVGLFNIVGTLGAGALGGRYSKKYLLSALYFSRTIVIALYVFMPLTVTSTLLFAGAIGVLWLSTVPLTSGLVGQIFGPRYMATLFGVVFLSHQIGSFLGVWLGGVVFDRTGSYDIVWWLSMALGIISALFHWPIDERPVARLAQPRMA